MSKEHSIQLIRQMGMNCMPEAIFSKSDIEGIKKFIADNPCPSYVVRDIYTPMGKYAFVHNMEECLEKVKDCQSDKFSLAASFRELPNRLLLGDILVKGGPDGMVSLTAKTSPNATHRSIYDDPEIVMNVELFDDKLWRVPGFELLIDYINRFNLYDTIVEFVVFNDKVGINNENVVIVELRSDY